MENLHNDSRGAYYTFFHETAHAIDYYYQQDHSGFFQGALESVKEQFGNSTFYTDQFEKDGKTLTDHMYEDAKKNFTHELTKELESSKYNNVSSEEKQKMVDNVTANLLEQNSNYKNLSSEERELQKAIQRSYKDDLSGSAHNTASDVYGGLTNKVIEGGSSHGKDYWLNEDGTRKREPNREGFAEYYGRIMSPDGDDKPGVQSVEKYLPDSKQHMDEIFELIGKE